MGLFLISFTLTILTGYFITAIFEQKNFIKIFIYLCTVMFAAIVLNVEILSLMNAISKVGIIAINTLLAIASGIVWFKKGKPSFYIKPKRFFKRLYYALMTDKYLLVLGLSFLFMIFVSLIIIAIMPVPSGDAAAYHVLRSLFWIGNKNLNHFVIADMRNLVMPINSEILYLWLFIFLKKQLWMGIFSFIGLLLSVFSLYGILGKIGVSERHKLWTIFITASFPSVVILCSGTETDIIISGLVLSSIYLFWEYLKNRKTSDLFVSSLTYAIAIGTKTPALMLMFPVGLWMLWMSKKIAPQNYYKIILSFLSFGVINFIIFSSYNYVLNFIDYGNIFGPKSFLQIHNNLYGIKGAFANYIKNLFLFFDYTGFHLDNILGDNIVKLRNSLLSFLHLSSIPDGILTADVNKMNYTLYDSSAGLGILGFIVFMPSWIYALVKPIFKRDNKTIMIFSFGLILAGAIFVMSYTIPFMTYNSRFFTSFCLVGAPILMYSYHRKNSIWKFIITSFALFGLLLISTHIWRAPMVAIVSHFQKGYTISQIRQISMCNVLKKNTPNKYSIPNAPSCMLHSMISALPKNSNILYFPNHSEDLLIIKLLDFYGYKIDYKLLEDIDNINFDNYDTVLIRNNNQVSSVMNPENIKKSPLYSPEEGVICEYLNESDKEYLYNTQKAPYLSVCEVDDKFFKNHNFTAKNTVSIIFTENKGTIYTIWRKKKL